jgi:hypothetical protein
MLLNNGKTGTEIIQINNPSGLADMKMNLVVTGRSRLLDENIKNPLGMATIKRILATPQGEVVDPSNVFFGDKKLSLGDLDKVIYDGTQAVRVYAPVALNGGIDYAELERLSALEQEAFSHKD